MMEVDIDRRFPLERTRRRMLVVDTAGEAGAIAVYRAQLLWSPVLDSETCAFLREALSHEQEHFSKFSAAMEQRNLRPCPGTVLWVAGGWLLGFISVFGGKRGIMACTAAIETAVHGHLIEQIAYLKSRDPSLAAMIEAIRLEEEAHRDVGLAGYDPQCRIARLFTWVVSGITESLIWIATFGDSTRLCLDETGPAPRLR